MLTPGHDENPSKRQRKPLPDCLTRLLQVGEAGPAAGRSPSSTGPNSGYTSYVSVLATTWLHLDRLAHLTGAMAGAGSDGEVARSTERRRRLGN
jgi:hypothetical protein